MNDTSENEVKLITVNQTYSCKGCVFYHAHLSDSDCKKPSGFPCYPEERKDRRSVIWVIDAGEKK